MLCLGRMLGERVFVGDDIVITVIGINTRGQVKLGIEAPSGVKIMREELLRSDHPLRRIQVQSEGQL